MQTASSREREGLEEGSGRGGYRGDAREGVGLGLAEGRICVSGTRGCRTLQRPDGKVPCGERVPE